MRWQAAGVPAQRAAHVVDLGNLDAGFAEHALEGELDRLLAAANDQVPGLVAAEPLGLAQDRRGAPEEAARHLLRRHISTMSPGWKSGFRSQYQVVSDAAEASPRATEPNSTTDTSRSPRCGSCGP